MRENDSLWKNKWSIKKYKPIINNFVMDKRGSDKEPESSIWMSSLSEAMGDYFREGMRVLDYGCGYARYVNFLSERLKNFHYTGLEIKGGESEVILKGGVIEKFNDNRVDIGFIGDDIENEIYENVDVILLGSIFTHLKFQGSKNSSFIGICNKFKPTLDNGGIVVFSLFIKDKTYTTDNTGTAYGIKECYGLSYYSFNDINKYVKSKKLKITEIGNFIAQGIHNHRIFRMEKSVV